MAQIYKDWVRSNAGTVTALESSLSALTWLLPNRFTGSELALEAVQAALGLLQLCNERILAPEPPQVLPYSVVLKYFTRLFIGFQGHPEYEDNIYIGIAGLLVGHHPGGGGLGGAGSSRA